MTSEPAACPSLVPVLTLDCLALLCPMPVIELARALPSVPVGALVEVLADDPAAGPDLAAWCRMRGQSLESSAPPRFLIRRQL